jgi:hypothetical protein
MVRLVAIYFDSNFPSQIQQRHKNVIVINLCRMRRQDSIASIDEASDGVIATKIYE